ncbi:MAG TPA: hypothetical protein VFF42_00510 [Candidatus Eremiobacteraceae bacterium]|jgi:hypothetical protein|nr:hypothetical protein [Candidatus Eremiobacteraceae bacterium]
MARGWESKDVESQVDEKSKAPEQKSGRGAKGPEQLMREQTIQDLELSRTRIVNDLSGATNPNHRKSLELALAHLDKKIAELK